LGRGFGPRRRSKCEGPGEEIEGSRRQEGPVAQVEGSESWV